MASPVSPAAGSTPDKTFWDIEIYDRWVAHYGAWTSYTPTWTAATTNPSLGNGTLVGAYKAIGKTVHFRLRMVAGSTTTFGSGLWAFTLPSGYSVASAQAAGAIIVNAAATARYPGGAYLTVSGGVNRVVCDGSSGLNATQPFTWNTSCQVVVGGVYEAS